MVRRGPKRRKSVVTGTGVEPLESRNIVVAGHRTSMRLEPSMWAALEEITEREQMSVNDLCSMIKERLESQARLREGGAGEVTLTSAVRVFIAAYFRRASTDEGHIRAGHGSSDPFTGTPFDCPAINPALSPGNSPSAETTVGVRASPLPVGEPELVD